MKHVCFAHGGKNTFDGAQSESFIELQQTGIDRFTVVYGLSVKVGLNYGQAASELGACLMHHEACAGNLDNRTKSEARASGDSVPYIEKAV